MAAATALRRESMVCNECRFFNGSTSDGLSICKHFELSGKGSIGESVYNRPPIGCKHWKPKGEIPREIEEFDPDMRRVRFSIKGRRKK